MSICLPFYISSSTSFLKIDHAPLSIFWNNVGHFLQDFEKFRNYWWNDQKCLYGLFMKTESVRALQTSCGRGERAKQKQHSNATHLKLRVWNHLGSLLEHWIFLLRKLSTAERRLGYIKVNEHCRLQYSDSAMKSNFRPQFYVLFTKEAWAPGHWKKEKEKKNRKKERNKYMNISYATYTVPYFLH